MQINNRAWIKGYLLCSNGEYVGVLEMLCLLYFSLSLVLLFTHARLLPWQAICKVSPLSMATFHPSSENYAHALCHSMANHRLVLGPVGIGFTILLRLSLTPSLQEFEARHSHPFPYPTWNATDKVYTFRISGMAANNSSLYHEDSDLNHEAKRYSFNLR